MKRIKIDRKKCIGCLTCTTACKVSHGSRDTRGRIVINSEGRYAPIYCRHCTRPECVYACPTGAMRKDDESKYVIYDKSRCATCFMCIMACPYGVLKMDYQTNREVMKCDMCISTEQSFPQCVDKWPMNALTLEEVDE